MKSGLLPGLAVLNPGGRDPDQSYEAGAGLPDRSVHAPVNYHAYAACTAGGFYRTLRRAAAHRNVLLLLRDDLRAAHKAFRLLKLSGCFVAIAFKEAGMHQVAAQLRQASAISRFRTLAAEADLCLASTAELVALYQAVSHRVAEVPTPYPIDVPAWDFARPLDQRQGIFIGTREFDVPTRNHLPALLAAKSLGVPLTVIARARDKANLSAIGLAPGKIRVLPPRPYPVYLEQMAAHRLVLQFDHSTVPGQVAGDALLCGLPTAGGNGATERIILPELNGYGRDFRTLLDCARRLLHENDFYQLQVRKMKELAAGHLSFQVVRAQLAHHFPGVCG